MNTTDSTEKNGRSHASTDKIHRPKESMPGCFIATEIDIAIVRLERGTAVTGLKMMYGTFDSPTMSNRSPAVTRRPQNTALTIAA